MDKESLLKLTVPKLREEALKIENIAGVHGMKKAELLEILFDHFGIPQEEKKPKRATSEVKKHLVELRTEREKLQAAGADKKALEVLRRRIHRTKRLTRQ